MSLKKRLKEEQEYNEFKESGYERMRKFEENLVFKRIITPQPSTFQQKQLEFYDFQQELQDFYDIEEHLVGGRGVPGLEYVLSEPDVKKDNSRPINDLIEVLQDFSEKDISTANLEYAVVREELRAYKKYRNIKSNIQFFSLITWTFSSPFALVSAIGGDYVRTAALAAVTGLGIYKSIRPLSKKKEPKWPVFYTLLGAAQEADEKARGYIAYQRDNLVLGHTLEVSR